MKNSMLSDFLALIYPELCFACGKGLLKQEKCICTFCKFHLPKTQYHNQEHNPISKLFWGRVNVHSASAYYHFEKGGKVQELIHQLKYNRRQNIGYYLGESLGKVVMEAPWFEDIDVLIPMPLHSIRMRERGFNQSFCVAQGISAATHLPMNTALVQRIRATRTQTKLTPEERLINVAAAFSASTIAKESLRKSPKILSLVSSSSSLVSFATL